MLCTWVDCKNEACHPQVGKGGNKWADLCGMHHAILELASDGFISGKTGPGPMLAAWVKASGGAKKMANAMVGGR